MVATMVAVRVEGRMRPDIRMAVVDLPASSGFRRSTAFFVADWTGSGVFSADWSFLVADDLKPATLVTGACVYEKTPDPLGDAKRES